MKMLFSIYKPKPLYLGVLGKLMIV